MERVKRNADRKQNVEMRRLIDDPDARDEPLEILEEKISVFEKAEHAQIHADAGNEPRALAMSILRFADLTPEPEIHRGGGEKKRGKGRVPCAVKNITRNDEEIFSQRPRRHAPVKSNHDYEE